MMIRCRYRGSASETWPFSCLEVKCTPGNDGLIHVLRRRITNHVGLLGVGAISDPRIESVHPSASDLWALQVRTIVPLERLVSA